MRLSELFQLLIGLFLCLSMECGRTDHVHLKIHVPDVVHKHKHVKTKYVHVFHPKVVHTDHHASVQYLHSRNDPSVGAFSQPNTEYRISEDDFNKWRHAQQRKALEKQRKKQQQHQHVEHDYHESRDDEEEEANYDEIEEDELFKKHRANKANSAALSNKKAQQQKEVKNHNYAPDYESSNADKVYARKPSKKQQQRRPNRPPSKRTRPDNNNLKQYQVYGTANVDAESSNVEQQYSSVDPTAIDPGYYSTLPRDVQHVPPSNQDDIYSGLMSKKYNKNIEDKSKLLADINYNRKQQTKNLLQRRRGQ